MRAPTAPSSDSVICQNNSQTTAPYLLLPIYYEKIQLKNSQTEEMDRGRVYGKGAWRFQAFSRCTTSLHLHVITSPELSETLWLELVLWLHYIGMGE